MASQQTKFSVGLFVLGGVGIALVAVIWIGMSSLFQKGEQYVTYFDESVQGLDVDSPVKYRGVSVGRVERIGVAPDSKLIEVVLKIESGQDLEADMVAQLKNVGITGLMFVELDRMDPQKEDRSPKLDFPARHRVIQSKPSDIGEIMRGLDDIIRQVKDLDLGGISDRVKATLESANQAIVDADVKAISGSIQRTMADVNRILEPKRWNRIVGSVEKAVVGLERLMEDADQTVTTADNTLARVDGIVVEKRATILKAIDEFGRAMENANRFLEKGTTLAGNTDDSIAQLRRYLTYTAQNLERASENLNRVTESLADQPSELLFGEPPPRREVEPEP